MIPIFKVTLLSLGDKMYYATVTLLQNLGLNINEKKSVIIPTQTLEFLGLLNSILMVTTLTACQADSCTEKWN